MRCRFRAVTLLSLGVTASLACAGEARFFTAGDGRLSLVSVHDGTTATVTYRRADGTYDEAALARLRRVLRSRDGKEGPIEPRFVELLGWLYEAAGGRPLRIQSGYRSPAYNEAIRSRGAKAASGSLHTEGMAADVALEHRQADALWHRLRERECCGAGFYPSGGFLHVDVGPPRFWDEKTSRVDENLSGGNARLFARTDFDRYGAGDAIHLGLHALTAPPVRVARTARLGGSGTPLEIATAAADADGCIEVDALSVLVLTVPAAAHGRDTIVLTTCAPRPERTPETVRTNPIEIEATPPPPPPAPGAPRPPRD